MSTKCPICRGSMRCISWRGPTVSSRSGSRDIGKHRRPMGSIAARRIHNGAT